MPLVSTGVTTCSKAFKKSSGECSTHSCPPYSPSANEPPFSHNTTTLTTFPTQRVFACFLDDVYVVVPPNRVRPVYATLAHTLQSQASIHLNQGRTRAWNAAGIESPKIRDLGEDVSTLPATSQGMTVLGAPIGSAAFVQHQLQHANQQHQHLLDRIPHLEDLQASWLLLLHCASPRSYLLRMCSPNVTTEFANNHDFGVAACLRRLLQVEDLPAQALATGHLPLSQGGLGLTCASVLATPAFWSSWADSLPVIHNQLPQYAGQILEQLHHPPHLSPISNHYTLVYPHCCLSYWRLAQHIATLPQERWIRRILRWCPAGRHRTGRPHFHWESKLESYCRYKGLGRWIDAAMNRDVWDQHCKSFIEFCCT